MDSSSHSPLREIPSTPSRSMSTPIVNAIRQAHQSATREFDQFYGYISQVMTPRRSQQQQQQRQTHQVPQGHIRKTTPKNTTRIKQQLGHRHGHKTNTSSLTPLMENHSIQSTNIQPMASKKRRRDYPPPRAMTLTPNTVRSSTTSDRCLLQLDDDHDVVDNDLMNNVYLRSPRRSTTATTPTPTIRTPTPSRHQYYFESPTTVKRQYDPDDMPLMTEPPASPSLFLQDQLLDESRRLDQLQQHFDMVQQRCIALTSRHRSPSSYHQKPSRQYHSHDDEQTSDRHRYQDANNNGLSTRQRTPPARAARVSPSRPHHRFYGESPSSASPQRRSTKFYDEPSSSILQRASSPPPKHTSPSSSPPLHPRYSIPSSKSTPAVVQASTPPIPSSLPMAPPPPPPPPSAAAPSRSSDGHQQQPDSGHARMMNDIPKAQLKSAKTIMTPNGSRVKNKFWAEIHGGNEKDDDELFWINEDDDDNTNNHHRKKKRSQLTDRLEQVKTIQKDTKDRMPPGRSPSSPQPGRQNQHKRYPADFFEELTHTLKGKPNHHHHDDDDDDQSLD